MKALLALLLLPLGGCVLQSKYDESQKQIESLNKQLKETTDGLTEANSKWAECRAHKYQFMLVGFRTFRFDTVTGASCIQLSTDSDWKTKKTRSQSCDCTDLFVDGGTPNVELRKLYCGW
jgi:hypothetical protein